MALAFAVPANGTDSSTTDGTGFTTGSVTFTAGRTYVMVVSAIGASAATPTSIVGAGTGTWSTVVPTSVSFNPVSGAAARMNGFTVTPGSTVTETLAITYPSSRTACCWGIIEITGQDTVGTFVQGDNANSDTVGSVAAMTNNTMSLAAFADAVNNGTLMFLSTVSGSGSTPSGSLTELFDIAAATPTLRLAAYYQIGQNTVPSATYTAANSAALAWEIKALAAASGGLPLLFFTRDL